MWSSVSLKGHSSPVYAIVADEKYIYSASGDRIVTRWDISSYEHTSFTVQLDSPAYCLHLVHNKLFICCHNGTILCIDIVENKLVWEINLYGQSIFSLLYLTHQESILAGDGAGNVIILNELGEKRLVIPSSYGKIRKMIEINKETFAIGSQDGAVRFFNQKTFNETHVVQIHQGSVYAMLLNSENELLTGGQDGQLASINTSTFEINFKKPAHYQSIYGLIKCGNHIVSASLDKSIKIWNTSNWQVEQKIVFQDGGHNKSVNALFPISKHAFASAGDDKLIKIWKKAEVKFPHFELN